MAKGGGKAAKERPQPSMREALAVRPGTVDLAGYPTDARPLAPTSKNADLDVDVEPLRGLQERLWAEATAGGRRCVLLVLQGIDTAGKGGVTEHVAGVFGPIGVQYTAFKQPTDEEREHDFLWRIRKRLPPAGVIGVFDRSHYEDVLVARVHELVPETEWRARYDVINDFEAELTGNGTVVLKCLLHISYDEQRDRLRRRLERADKHWKFSEADIEERARWSEYQAAFSEMLERCSTPQAPWYVVPSDHKKYRNWAVAQVLRETLLDLDPHYPQPPLDVEALQRRLDPPH